MQQTDIEDEPVNKVLYTKHRRGRKNDLIAAMYAMYCLPRSIEQVAEVYHKTRQNVYELFKSREYELRHKEMRGLQVIDDIAFTVSQDGYLRGTIRRRRIRLHRYIWEKNYGPLIPGYAIRHKDNDKNNNKIENLELYMRKQGPRSIRYTREKMIIFCKQIRAKGFHLDNTYGSDRTPEQYVDELKGSSINYCGNDYFLIHQIYV